MSGRYVRAGLLFGFAALIGKLFVADEMVKYMSPALDPLTALTGVLLAVMGATELRGAQPEADDWVGPGVHEHGADQTLTSLLLVVPLVLGFVLVPRALGATALGGENVANMLLSFGPTATQAATAAPPSAPIRDVPDLLTYLQQAGMGGVGQRVELTGVVVPSDELGPDEFALLRFAIAHCVADARPIGLLVVAGRGASWPADGWVRVAGTLSRRERDGDQLVSVEAETITRTEEPSNPYLASRQ